MARRLRALSFAVEGALLAAIVGSVASIGSVHSWAYVPLGMLCLGIALLLAWRGQVAGSLRRLIGRRRVAFHPSGCWIGLDGERSQGFTGWSVDLGRPLFSRPPLLWPGVAFLTLIVLQLLPLPVFLVEILSLGQPQATRGGGGAWRPLTISVHDTLRGGAFLAAALVIHAAAATVFESHHARARLRKVLAGLGLVLALVAFGQMAAGADRIYGVFRPLEAKPGQFFGPFVNRNHYAGYMLMVVPMCMSLVARAYRGYVERVGDRANARRRVVALGGPEGTTLLYVLAAAFAAAASLVATTSRGGLIAFAAGLILAAASARRRAGFPPWLLALAIVGVVVSWYGLERLGERFERASGDAPSRVVVWRGSLSKMGGRWLTGSGFNTFGEAMSRTVPWTLPVGATPWPASVEAAAVRGERIGFRAFPELQGFVWYREAHNDYVQVLTEAGLPGLTLALWAAGAVLIAVRRDPWLLAALGSVLLHEIVDFDLQIPAIALLFVTVAAMPPVVTTDASSTARRGSAGS